MSQEDPAVAGQHFGGVFTAALVAFLSEHVGTDGMQRVLRAAGESREVATLTDAKSWSTYEQFRRLLEATSAELADPSELAEAGRMMHKSHTYEVTSELNSPERFYEKIELIFRLICPITTISTTRLDDRTWLVTHTFAAGFEPYEQFCTFISGQQEFAPTIFGAPPAEVVRVDCRNDGGSQCAWQVRWEPIDEASREVVVLTARLAELEGYLRQFEEAFACISSGQDLQTVIALTFESACRAVYAPVCVLALHDVPRGVQRVYSIGVDAAEAIDIASEVTAADGEVDGLVCEIATPRRKYGYLNFVRPAVAFFPHESARLQVYGRFIAAALDSAAALDDAQRQGETATALLELSTALAEVTNVNDMAGRLVRAIPAVVDCDHACVVLPNAERTHAHVVAAHGYTPRQQWLIENTELPIVERAAGQLTLVTRAEAEPGSRQATFMAMTKTEATMRIPVYVDGEWAGELVAGVTSDPDRLRPTTEVRDRLRGLAAQASTAFGNARLLDQVRHQALHDPLTGLPNRALILDRVEQMLARAHRTSEAAGAMFIDLDGFKEINDTFGHGAGDELLRGVTARLKATLRPSDTIGRLGGDEFVVLVDGASLSAGPELVAERLLAVLREPFDTEEDNIGPLSVTASIGIATGPRATAGDLLRDADIALYQAKGAGKNCFRLFEEEMQTQVHDRLLLQMDLHSALAEDQFFLVYQPVCNLVSGEITSVEALLRWQHPTRGEIQPNDFIMLLEETGLIVEVGRWVITQACRQAAQWRADGMEIDMAVNVSGRQLQTGRFIDDVRSALEVSGLTSAALVVEITESTMMTDVKATAAMLREIKTLGVRIAIDDFGTGYSSLAVLRDFPVDTLKIDRAFVSGLGNSRESAALIRTLVQLGKTLGLTTLAEGIEDSTQYAHLQDEACESGQGFLIARPMLAESFSTFLRGRFDSASSDVGLEAAAS